MKRPRYNVHSILRYLDIVYQELEDIHSREVRAIGSAIPVGGEGWMDSFFKMEGIRGMITSLRNGKSLEAALKDGETVSSISVKIWNAHWEYQVHR